MANNNWNTMVKITVPAGLNGWRYSGAVKINGKKWVFPVGVATEVPEPVAEHLKAMMDEEEQKKAAAEKNPLTSPHQAFVTDSEGNPVWEDRTHYSEEQSTLVWETPFTFERQYSDGNYGYIAGGGATRHSAELFHTLPDGALCMVEIKGEVYRCHKNAHYTDFFLLGNRMLYSYAEDELDAELPFVLVGIIDSATEEWFESMKTSEFMGDELTVKVYYVDTTVHPLDDKYIPDTIARVSDLEGVGGGVQTVNGIAPDDAGNVEVEIPEAVTDDHINSLIDAKLGVIENGTY